MRILYILTLFLSTISASAQTIYKVPKNGTNTVFLSSGTITDPGGNVSSTYPPATDGALSIFPPSEGAIIGLFFSSLSVLTGDYVNVYNGPDDTYPLIASFNYKPTNTIYASNDWGALTVRFVSNSTGQATGFSASVSTSTRVQFPNVQISSQTLNNLPNELHRGNTISLYPSLHNPGSFTVSSKIRLYFSIDPYLDDNDVVLATSQVVSLAPGEHKMTSMTNYKVSDTLLPGLYYLLFMADPDQQVTERYEDDNLLAWPLHVSDEAADFTINMLSLSQYYYSDFKTLFFEFRRNCSNKSINMVPVSVYASADSLLSEDDSLILENTTFEVFEQYQADDFFFNYSEESSRYLMLVLDPMNQYTEKDEENNRVAIPIHFPVMPNPPADYVMRHGSFTPLSLGEFNITYAFRDFSTLGPRDVKYFISTDTVLNMNEDSELTEISDQSFGYRQVKKVKSADNLDPGMYSFFIYGDPDNIINEVNENNNAIRYNVIAPDTTRDYILTSFSSQQAYFSNYFPISFEVMYDHKRHYTIASGMVRVIKEIPTAFYLSTDTLYDDGDSLIAVKTTNQYGQTITQGLWIFNIDTIKYIIAKTDYNNSYPERNEDNNYRFIKLFPNQHVENSPDTLSLADGERSLTTCNGLFFDPGKDQNYSSGSPSVLTIYPDPEQYLHLDIAQLSINPADSFAIFNGADTFSPLVSRTVVPGRRITAEKGSPLTLYFNPVEGGYPGIAIRSGCSSAALKPDLKVQDLTAMINSARKELVFNALILETTSLASDKIPFKLCLSKDTTFSADDITIQNFTVDYFHGGLSVNDTGIFESLSEGNYFALLIADPNQQIEEENEHNNTYFYPVYFVEHTGEAIGAYELSPLNVQPGEHVKLSYKYEFTNTISGNDLSLKYYIINRASKDTVAETEHAFNIAFYAWTGPYSIQDSVQVPVNIPEGEYCISANLSSSQIQLSRDTNVNFVITVKNPAFAISLSGVEEYNVNTLTPVDYLLKIRNKSNAPSLPLFYQLYLTTSLEQPAEEGILLYSSDSLNLKIQETRDFLTTVTLPEEINTGIYFLKAIVKPVGTVGFEEFTSRLNIGYYADFKASSIQVSHNPAEKYSTLKLLVGIENLTPGDESNVLYTIFLSQDTVYDQIDLKMIEGTADIKYGKVNYILRHLTTDFPVSDNQFIILVITAAGQEENYTNNQIHLPFSIQEQSYDLVLTAVTFNNTTAYNTFDQFPVTFTVENNSAHTASNVRTRFYLSQDENLDQNDKLISNFLKGSLTAFSTNTSSLPAAIPKIPTGEYFIIAVTDSDSLYEELNEENNMVVLQNKIQVYNTESYTDFYVNSTNREKYTEHTEQPAYFSFSAGNKGPYNGAYTNYKLYISADTIPGIEDLEVSSGVLQPIRAGGTSNFNFQYNMPLEIATGDYYYIIYLDPDNDLGELQASLRNNYKYIPLSILPDYADYTFEYVEFPHTEASPGDFLNYGWYPFNAGFEAVGIAHHTVCISSDQIFDPQEDYIVNEVTSDEDFYDQQHSSMVVPQNISPGSYYVIFLTDSYQIEPELSEENNIRIYPLTIVDVTAVTTNNEINHLYPNPALHTAYWNAEMPIHELQMYQDGKLVYKTKTSETAGKIDLAGFPSGVYVVKFITEGEVFYKKLIKL